MSKVVAIAGATGAVGEVLAAGARGAGLPRLRAAPPGQRALGGHDGRPSGARPFEVREAAPEAFDGVDFVFFAATGCALEGACARGRTARRRRHRQVQHLAHGPEGAAGHPRGERRGRRAQHEGIIASPNCTTIGVRDGARAPAARGRPAQRWW